MFDRSRMRALIGLLVVVLAAVSVGTASADRDSVRIVRDDYGVAHVYGHTVEAVFHGMGYVAADDRMWQAEIFRRSATGTMAELFGLDDPDAPTTIPAEGANGQRGRRAGVPPPDLPDATGGVQAPSSVWENAELQPGRPASNGIVIGSRLSASGAPLLLGGPQFAFTTPGLPHEIGLHGGGFDVTGMTIAGIPLVAIGVGNGHAWTATQGGTDNSDVFVEQLNPEDNGQYHYQGQWRDLDCRPEQFGVAGQGDVTRTLCDSVHGPILGTADGVAFSFHNATIGHELDSLAAWMNLGRVHNIKGFEAQLDDIAHNFNVLYADHSGNIAYWHIGRIPVRADGVNPFFPTSGTGEDDWQGILPFADNPHTRNPDQGYLVSWNNKPEPGWENSANGFWMWGGAHRVNTLLNELEQIEPRTATISTLEQINRIGGTTTTLFSGFGDAVFVSSQLDPMLAAVDVDQDPRLSEVVAALAGWNGQQVDEDNNGFYDDPNGTIFNAWFTAIAFGVFDEVVPSPTSNAVVAGNLIDRVLRGEAAGLPLAYDYLEGTSVEDAVTSALVSALDELAGSFGTADRRQWRQPVARSTWDPLPLTPAAGETTWFNRGAYNLLVELRGHLDARSVLPPGQSGDPASPHFSDQLALFEDWEYKPLPLSKRDLRGHVESSIILRLPPHGRR